MNPSNIQARVLIHDEDRLRIMEIGAMCSVPMSLNAAVKLNVPEIIYKSGENAQLSASEIVEKIPNCKASVQGSLYLDRILRVLASAGVFKEYSVVDPDSGKLIQRKYGLTSICKYLVKNKDDVSLVSWILINQHEIMMKSWNYMYEAVIDGDEPFTNAHQKPVFELAGEDKKFNALLNSAMANHSNLYLRAALEAYEGFKGVGILVDVGGGSGVSLSVILAAHPNIKGINFDLQHVLHEAQAFEGVEHVRGDMFERVPEGDAIFMKCVLHDWDDQTCIKLLKNCYDSLPSDGKVIAMDAVLPSSGAEIYDSSSRFAFTMDVLMLAYSPGGKERTKEEFDYIAKAAGFVRVELVVTMDCISILEMHKK